MLLLKEIIGILIIYQVLCVKYALTTGRENGIVMVHNRCLLVRHEDHHWPR